VAFWIGAASVVGLSLLGLWKLLGLPWWVALAIFVLLFIWAVSEGAYSLWAEAEAKLAERGGVFTDGIARSVWSTSYRNDPDQLLCKFEGTVERDHAVLIVGGRGKPRAVQMLAPSWSEDLIYPADTPRVVKFRDGWNRHSMKIVKFVEGGFVVDDSDAPYGCGFECVVYFDEATSSEGQ